MSCLAVVQEQCMHHAVGGAVAGRALQHSIQDSWRAPQRGAWASPIFSIAPAMPPALVWPRSPPTVAVPSTPRGSFRQLNRLRRHLITCTTMPWFPQVPSNPDLTPLQEDSNHVDAYPTSISNPTSSATNVIDTCKPAGSSKQQQPPPPSPRYAQQQQQQQQPPSPHSRLSQSQLPRLSVDPAASSHAGSGSGTGQHNALVPMVRADGVSSNSLHAHSQVCGCVRRCGWVAGCIGR
jgi:hypothetical protein